MKRSKLISQPKQEFHLDKAYESLFELPLYNWVKRILEDDNKWLVISGNPSGLEELWEQLKGQYQDMIESADTSQIIDLTRDISMLRVRLKIIESVVAHLKIRRSEKLIEILRNDLGFFKLKYDDLEKDLERTLNRAKADIVELKRKITERDVLYKVDEHEKEWTEYDYIKQLSELSKFQGGGVIHIKQINVAEYVALLNRFKAYCKETEQAYRK
jgi:hypothetical protein